MKWASSTYLGLQGVSAWVITLVNQNQMVCLFCFMSKEGQELRNIDKITE